VKREASIRFRLTVWYGSVVAAGLIVFAALIWILLRQTLMHEIDRELEDRAHSFEAFLKSELAEVPAPPLKEELEEFCTALPTSSYVRLRRLDSNFVFSYPRSSRQAHSYRSLNREITAREGQYAVEIGIPLDTIQHILNILQILLISLIPAVILVACAGSIWLSRRALKPVDNMTGAARAISIENLSSRLPVPQTGDELQRLAEAWNTMLARLEAAINRISQFAADASHELRTPLAIIQTSAELALRRVRSPEQYRESLEEIVGEAQKMTQLVEDLLFLARSDASSAEMPVEPLDLSEVVQEACSELHMMAEFRGVTVRRLFPNAPVLVKGNKPALRRLFLVLLDNAIKYSEPHGEVTVAVSSDSKSREVVIKDCGAGISPQDLPHIFERFYRSEKARTHADGGHGLGLALAESIARRHGATINVQTSLGKGSEFRVSFGGKHSTIGAAEAGTQPAWPARAC
jgi:two-component system, OmpR family, heavy metal sensor histidine kinase CusS